MLPTNLSLMKLARRAEDRGDDQMLVETFVDVGPLFTLLSSTDHQIVYGRRGTGKTHALTYLRVRADQDGDLALLVDLRTIGSTGGLYADSNLPVTERGTRLLLDVLAQLHDQLVDYALDLADTQDMTAALKLLDNMAEAITEVEVVGEHEQKRVEVKESELQGGGKIGVKLDAAGPRAEAAIEGRSTDAQRREKTDIIRGSVQHRVHFGRVSQVLQRLVDELPVTRVWVLLDEWAAIPLELQPLLADLLRRAIFPVRGMVVKIAAIEQRSRFTVSSPQGDYLGIEMGADAQADLDLDDYMVFGNDPDAAKAFFRELFFKHVRAQAHEDGQDAPRTASEFQRMAFTQRNAFDELVRAAEGVPRDAINIVRIAAQRAADNPISVQHVRTAAHRWYVSDKEKTVQANPEAAALLHWVIDTVIGKRRARAFLLEQGALANHPLITELYDARVLHVIKRSVSSRDRPGVRYDVYGLDFGCYVELITTTKAPAGLYEAEVNGSSGWVEVPADDYRSIRRAVLDLAEFENRPMGLPVG
jgi:hypothetical protein